MNNLNQDLNESKKTLMNISMELFAEKNFDRVSVDEICKRAGLTKGSFYHHFKSKYDIPVQQYREMQGEFYRDYEQSFNLEFIDRFKYVILWYAEYCTEDKLNFFINYYKVVVNSPKNKLVRRIEMETKVYTEILHIGMMQGYFRPEIDIVFFSEMISKFIYALLLDWAVFQGGIDLASELEYFYKNILKMLLK